MTLPSEGGTTGDRPAPILRWGRSVWGSAFDPHRPEPFFAQLAENKYNFVEIACPDSSAQASLWKSAAAGQGLGFVVQIHSLGDDPNAHSASLERQIESASELEPELVNAHTGRDIFSHRENAEIFSHATKAAAEFGVQLVHETHRSRAMFSGPSTMRLLEDLPSLRLCADLSHWCCVHESMLEDQPEAVSAALLHADYLHLRVGHTQGSQIPNLNAPEWEETIRTHLEWWRYKVSCMLPGQILRVSPEFGPFPYLSHPGSAEELWTLNETMRVISRNYFSGKARF
jgi:sugar phosphate isomerase/epimerase